MKTNFKKIGDCRFRCQVELDADTVALSYDKIFEEFSKEAKLPGFRKGKVPIAMIRQSYAEEATKEVTQELLSKSYAEAIKDHDPKPVSYPEISDVKAEPGKKMTYTAEFDVDPVIRLKKYKGIKVVRKSAEVQEKEVDKTLDSFRESRAVLKDLDESRPTQIGDSVVCDVGVVKDDGPSSNQTREATWVLKKEDGPMNFLGELVGMEIGQSKDIKVDNKWTYKVTIKKIQLRDLPELSDAFAKELGKDTVNELKDQIRKDMAKYLQSQSMDDMKQQIYEKLLKDNQFQVPKSMIQRQQHQLLNESGHGGKGNGNSQNNVPESIKEETLKKAERQIRLYYILEKVAEEEKVEVDDADVSRRIDELKDRVQKSAQEIEMQWGSEIRNQMKHDQATSHLISLAKITDEEIKKS